MDDFDNKITILFEYANIEINDDDKDMLLDKLDQYNKKDMNLMYEYVNLIKLGKITIKDIIDDLDNDISIYKYHHNILDKYQKWKEKDNPESIVGIYYCKSCKSPFTCTYSKQIRSADEGETTFIKCLNVECKALHKYAGHKIVSAKDRLKYQINKPKISKSHSELKNETHQDFNFGREKIYYIVKTIFELLKDRGYIIPEIDVKYINHMVEREELKVKYCFEISRGIIDNNDEINKKDIVKDIINDVIFDNGSCFAQQNILKSNFEYRCKHSIDNSDLIFFYKYVIEGGKVNTVSVNTTRETITYLNKFKIDKFILCSNCKLSQTSMKELAISGLSYTIYNDKEIMRNPTKHCLVPSHSLVSEKEKEELRKYADLDLFPVILIDDPICRYYGVSKGDMFFINRGSKYESNCPYRIVK